MKQYDELSAFCHQSLRDSTSWDNFQLAVQYVFSKGVVIDNTKCFDDFCPLKSYEKDNEKKIDCFLLLCPTKMSRILQ
jgi:hypothetical protein